MTEQVLEWIKAEKLIAQGDCVMAGVSGGADSVCLLRLLLEIQKKMDFTLEAVHVEHGIRGEESRRDADFVRALCGSFHVPCHIYAVDVPSYAKEKGLGLEEAARIRRYECFQREIEKRKEEKRNIKIALAHHADDNAETMLFQMVRGSGIAGLAGMRPKRPLMEGAELIRPLLNVQRREIESYLDRIGQEYRRDSTNADTDYSRNRIRHKILPELSGINEQAVSHMNHTAGILRQAADYLAQQAKEAVRECCVWETPERGELVFAAAENLDGSEVRKQTGQAHPGKQIFIAAERFLTYPEFLQNEMLHSILAEISGSSKDIGAVHVEEVRLLFQKQVGRSLNLPYGVRAERIYEGVRLRKAGALLSGSESLECLCRKPETRKAGALLSGSESRIQSCLAETEANAGKTLSGVRNGENAQVPRIEKISQKAQGHMVQKQQEYRLGEAEWQRLEAGEEIRILLPEGELCFRILEQASEVGEIHKKKYTKWLNYDKIKGDLQIRRRKPGDYLAVDLQGHKKKLKEYFVNEKIPRESRDNIWLLTQDAHVLWVIGGRISADYRISQQTKKILEVQAVGGSYHED